VFSKLIKTFRGNTKTKIFVSTLPINDDMMRLRNADCCNADFRNADYRNVGLKPHDMPNWSRMTCQTGTAWQLEIGALEPHDMMRLRNADCCNVDYRNSDCCNANYRNANYCNDNYRNTDNHHSDYRNADYSVLTTAMLTTGIPDCPASNQSGTGLRKTNDAGTNPVPE
jgi:hypothetical protein